MTGPQRCIRLKIGLTLLISASLSFSAFANPQGANIRHGNIRFDSRGDFLRVIQQGDRGIIDWNSFSIDSGQTTRFVHDNSRSATLNRVTGSGVSRIDGQLLANGRVFLLNSNGIVIGRDGVVDVAGFTASTLDLSDEQFLAGSDLVFQGNSQAAVINLGSVSASDGDIFLIASQVKNSGSLTAANGTVGLAAGNDVLIKESGSERVFVRGASGGDKDVGVENTGTIEANIAELKSHGGNIYGLAVKNEGRVAATGVTQEGGQIFLRAGNQTPTSSSGGGRIQSTGVLRAQPVAGGTGRVVVDAGETGTAEIGGTVEAPGGSESGGEVIILGETINVFDGALILADGGAGGGRIFVGGGRRGEDPSFMNATDVSVGNDAVLSASATEAGDGGEIVVFASRDLNFQGHAAVRGGTQSGDGGFVELSGKETVTLPSLMQSVDVSAVNGKGGMLLLDPNDITIFSSTAMDSISGSPTSANYIADEDVSIFLMTGSLTIETFTDGTGGNGDIFLETGATISWSTDNDLAIKADNTFYMASNSSILSTGSGDITLSGGKGIRIGSTEDSPMDAPTISANSGNITIENDPTKGNTEGVRVVNTSVYSQSGSVTIKGDSKTFNPGVVLEDVQIGTGSGNISIEGTSSGDHGVLVRRGVVSSSSGDIGVSGRAVATSATHYGVLVDDGEESSSFSQFLTGNNGTITFRGLGSGKGGHAVMFNDPMTVPSGGYVTGDDTQSVIFESLGGDILARYVQGEYVQFIDPDGIGQNFTLLDSDIDFFTAVNVGSVNIQNSNNLEIGNIKLATTADFTSQFGSISVTGKVDAGQAVSFNVGDGYYGSSINVSNEIISPQILFNGGENWADVRTEGIFRLNGVSFNNIYEVRAIGENGNTLIGADDNTTIDVFSDMYYGEGSFSEIGFAAVEIADPRVDIGSETIFEIDGTQFYGYDTVSGGKGNDTFLINLEEGADFNGELRGGQGDDKFVMMPGGSVGGIDGDAGDDLLDFSNFSTGVFADFGNREATQVGDIRDMERVVGGQGIDVLRGTDGDDEFRITSDNSGKLNNGTFRDFEILEGKGGGDRFVFLNQATVQSVSGDGGFDRLVLDDRDLGGVNTYTISNNSISRNPTYTFSSLEVLQLLLGPGDDTVVSRGNGLVQLLDGGAGYDTLDLGGGRTIQPNPMLVNGSTIIATNFENPYAPDEDDAGNNDSILTQQTQNVPFPDPFNNPGGNSFDQFSGNFDPTIPMSNPPGGGGGNAFAASVGTVVNQAVAIMIDGSEYLLGAPAALDGSSGVPPIPIIGDLLGNLDPEAWRELAEAIEFSGGMIMVHSDGPYSIDLTGVPPADVAAVLQEGLLAAAAQELMGALELTLVIPITSIDGPVGILAVPIVIDPEVIAELNGNLDDGAFNELSGALDQ